MAAYLLYGNTGVLNQDEMDQYRQHVGPTIMYFGGEFIIRGACPEALEGDWHPQGVTLIRFESRERLMEWYNSPEYAPLKELRIGSMLGDVLIIDAP
jgi:uncharacterized protein (DUF1330 family)